MKNERVIVDLVDDIDGTGNARTVSFAVDGVSYEIELNKKNEGRMLKAFQPYIAAARKVNGSRPTRRRRATKKVDSAAVRTWATENGVEVGSTGRIPKAVIDQYEAAKG
ncbi:nucloid associated Lsr2-like [Streptomyces phage Amela]|uniref:Lsr2-like DNA bridging protein n=1 Tax=Streptomyces phage Amela TaxID=1673877 RepID=A0A0K1YA95_9CAUD|nr:nucloid associated Lsr2-like [Streptomyces phage Amela]AKY03804.1 Lsr2-like DNA bridging protein [Streptomyces phage Amela]